MKTLGLYLVLAIVSSTLCGACADQEGQNRDHNPRGDVESGGTAGKDPSSTASDAGGLAGSNGFCAEPECPAGGRGEAGDPGATASAAGATASAAGATANAAGATANAAGNAGLSGGTEGSGGSTNATPGVTAIDAGSGNSCARLRNGMLYCWGYNKYGKLGIGAAAFSAVPVAVTGIENATAVTTGGDQTCAVLASGEVKCWGYNDYGQLGNGSATGSQVPVTVAGITSASAIASGSYHTCALLRDGSVQCWGWNADGQLGCGSTDICTVPRITASSIEPTTEDVPCSLTPVIASGIANATAVGAGRWHSCALLSDGTVKCWGYNSFGQLGDGTAISSVSPVTVSGITDAVAIAIGHGHNCALLRSGKVQCWGYNGSGELGNGMSGVVQQSLVPVSVLGVTKATAIAADSAHSCAVLSEGSIQCWGDNDAGQLGIGTTGSDPGAGPGVSTPVTVVGITNATSVAVGGNHTCALLGTGAIQCWGVNSLGALGNGSTTNSTVPVTVSGF